MQMQRGNSASDDETSSYITTFNIVTYSSLSRHGKKGEKYEDLKLCLYALNNSVNNNQKIGYSS